MNGLKATITTEKAIGGTLNKPKTVVDSNYELLKNKPSINGFTVEGDKSFEDYGLIFDRKTITEKDGALSVADNSHGHTVENVDGLEDILDAKADKKSLSDHKEDESNPHNVTKEQVGLGNVENKSSEDIRGELTKENVTDALGYTPPTENTTYDKATASSDGLMASGDKSKLDGIAEGANKYIHPAHTAKSSGLYKITVDGEGHVTAVTEVTKADITELGIPAQDTNTTYGAATQSANGLMSAADKKKLDGVAEGANKYVHPAYTAKSSGLYKITVDGEGHVTAVTAVTKADITALGIPAQDTNTTYGAATQSANGLMSANDKKKLDGVAEGANKYVHPAHTAQSSGLYKITVDGEGHVTAVTEVTKADITALGIPAQDTNTTYSAATQSSAGLMSATDKKKLDSAVSASSVAAVSGMVRQQRCPSDWFKYL